MPFDKAHVSDDNMGSSSMRNGGNGPQKTTLGKAQACHQCRKRKVRCDADRPCSNCRRSHQKMIRVNPHLSKVDPHCTYDEVPGMPWDVENDLSAENLRRLETRVEELEEQVRTGAKELQFNATPELQAFYSFVDSPRPAPDSSSEYTFTLPSEVLSDEWPAVLPPKPLFLHLVDLFFTCWPNARRVIHRPTFLTRLLEPPSSPRFPFIGLLHAICAAAALHSPYVSVAPMPDLRVRPSEDIFQEKTRLVDGRALAFDEEHYLLSKGQCLAAARIGLNLMEVSQDSLRDSLPERLRKKLLIDQPHSYTEVELRRNVFWCAYVLQRYHLFVSSWPFDISDEDIHQTLPGTLEAFEAGVDDGQERQNIFSSDLFTAHSDNLDDFGAYVKCAVLLSRIHVIQHRHLQKYDTIEEVRASHEIRAIDAMVSSIKASLSKNRFNPNEQSSSGAISNLFMAHMAPHLAAVTTHTYLADWSEPGCESANKALAAARSIIRYVSTLMAAPWDCARLDRTACLCWTAAARALLYSLQHAPEGLVPVLRAEIRLIRNAFLMAGGRVILFLRQRQSFDLEIVQELGERDAAKLFEEKDGLGV
ncbi:hypothetical protein FRC07_004166 [Ceratobasidium sp. 392]|nr:hypothetical protein FRC07_004166 [Ceratobasidium sp. 392]